MRKNLIVNDKNRYPYVITFILIVFKIFIFHSGGKIVDLHFKSAVEGVIIKWATQITEVLGADSVTAFKSSQHLTPWDGNNLNFKLTLLN